MLFLGIAFISCERENFDNPEFPKLLGQYIYDDKTYDFDHGIIYKNALGPHRIYLFSGDGRHKLELFFIVEHWPTEIGPPIVIDRILPGWYQFMGETFHKVGDKLNARISLSYRCDFSQRFEDSYPHYGVEIEKEEDGSGYYLRIFTQNEPDSPQIDRVECQGQFAVSTRSY